MAQYRLRNSKMIVKKSNHVLPKLRNILAKINVAIFYRKKVVYLVAKW